MKEITKMLNLQKQFKTSQNNNKDEFVGILLGTLGAKFIGNMLAGKGVHASAREQLGFLMVCLLFN